MVQLLRLPASTGGFDPWPGNQDSTCHVVWPNRKKVQKGQVTSSKLSECGHIPSRSFGRIQQETRQRLGIPLGLMISEKGPRAEICQNWKGPWIVLGSGDTH